MGKIIAETSDGIGWLTLNNPERQNAISLDMWQTIATVADSFGDDPAVRVIVLRGSGGRSFAAGADISEFEAKRSTTEQVDAYASIVARGKASLADAAKPVIAAIEGYCIGGGVTLALLADLRVAAETATFGIPAAKLGVAYNPDSLAALTAVVGPAVAKDLLFTGRRFDAAEALRIGLVNRVVPVEGFQAAVRETALEIARNAPLTIRSAKLVIDQLLRDPDTRDPAAVAASVRACLESEDYAIGRRAFMAKRAPTFVGR